MSERTWPYPLLPYQYEYVFQILQTPLAASELRPFNLSAQAKAGQLRPLIKRGWLTRSPSGIYDVTDKARRAVCW
jgi:hypothetical protein